LVNKIKIVKCVIIAAMLYKSKIGYCVYTVPIAYILYLYVESDSHGHNFIGYVHTFIPRYDIHLYKCII